MPDLSWMNNLGLIIGALVAIPFLIVAAVLVVMALRGRRGADTSLKWNQTAGRIVQSEVESHRSLDSDGTHTTIYDPVVGYEYAVGGERYRNNRIRFGDSLSYSWPGPSEEVVGRYRVGNTVTVYYNPANPTEAVLERQVSGSSNILLLVAGFIVVLVLCTCAVTAGITLGTGRLVSAITSQVQGVVTQVSH